jgi:hypothetical protein
MIYRGWGKQCCGSGTFIPDPDFYPYQIPELTIATNLTKLKIILFKQVPVQKKI